MRQLRPWRVALAAVFLTPTVLTAQSSADERESPEVRKLVLRGVNSVTKDDLQESIATEASRCRGLVLRPFCWFSHSDFFVEKHFLDRGELRRDVLRIKVFYWKRGFRSAKVDTTVTDVKGGVKVT